MAACASSSSILFGGDRNWRPKDWTDSDDRVRGGKSQSYLKTEKHQAVFCGTLDIETLGGAGFASQRTTGDDQRWDLSQYDGIEVIIDGNSSDDKTYTIILKDELLPPDPDNGREQSTTSWEYDFTRSDAQVYSGGKRNCVVVPWAALKPTYRGRPKDDAKPLAKDNIKRFSIMMRSFFGTQDGDFSLTLISINGLKVQEPSTATHADLTDDDSSGTESLDKPTQLDTTGSAQPFWTRWFCLATKI